MLQGEVRERILITRMLMPVSGEALKSWSAANKLNLLENRKLHVTLMYSTNAADWSNLSLEYGLVITTARGITIFQDKIVLLLDSSYLDLRHAEFSLAGFNHSYPDFNAHISIADVRDNGHLITFLDDHRNVSMQKQPYLNPNALSRYTEQLIFGPEICRPIW